MISSIVSLFPREKKEAEKTKRVEAEFRDAFRGYRASDIEADRGSD